MATFSQTITNGNYDSSQYGTGNSASLSTNPVAISGGTRFALFYFPSVTIPAGSTVSAATMTVTVANTSNDDPNLAIVLNDVASAAAPTSGTDDISGRAQTSASTNWVATGIGTGAKTTPDFAAAVQEIIDRGDWASGNNLAVIFDGISSTAFAFYMSEQGGGSEPSISITYTPPAAGDGQPMAARARLVPGMRRPHGHQGW